MTYIVRFNGGGYNISVNESDKDKLVKYLNSTTSKRMVEVNYEDNGNTRRVWINVDQILNIEEFPDAAQS